MADDVAGGAFAAHFFLNSSTRHQASISLSSSFGSARAGWRQKAASCAAENSFRIRQPRSAFHHIPPGHHCLPTCAAIHPHHHVLRHAALLSNKASIEEVSLQVSGFIGPELQKTTQVCPEHAAPFADVCCFQHYLEGHNRNVMNCILRTEAGLLKKHRDIRKGGNARSGNTDNPSQLGPQFLWHGT